MAEPLVVDVRDPVLWQDPYPTWDAARAQHRVARTPSGEPILLSADDLDVVGAGSGVCAVGP